MNTQKINISTNKIYLLGISGGIFYLTTELNEGDDIKSKIKRCFCSYDKMAITSIKEDGSSLFKMISFYDEIESIDIENSFQSLETLKVNPKYDIISSRLYTFKKIDIYCDTNFAEVYSNIIDKNQ
jgi:hypothetical protein